MNNHHYFKFRDINKNSINSLVKGSIYFSPPDKLNDPFDCNLDVKKSITNAARDSCSQIQQKLIDLLKDENFFAKFRKKISEIGICSFTLKLKDVLLWSHYANDHKGMSILYEFPERFLNDGNKFIGVAEVSYKENSLTNWFASIASKLPMTNDDLGIELAKQFFTSKSPAWEYEEEVRIIRPIPGALRIEKTFIKQICFGLNTSNEDIELIKEIIRRYKHKVELCRVIRTDSDFGIDVKKI